MFHYDKHNTIVLDMPSWLVGFIIKKATFIASDLINIQVSIILYIFC